MKTCSHCKQVKDEIEFYLKKQTVGGKLYVGRQSRCKSCNAAVCLPYNRKRAAIK